ncbi:aromatic ring-hydroxylating oxygenase subunit alpha [Geminicoccus roseus]|uniref:hypothetical protein n=1 Tax=Geminicoccus roseus TaxID=404900 RepID=UPI00042971DD|nr:hypothetical protein [Geminicoccus roseus]
MTGPSSPALLRLEDERLWPRAWVCVGSSADIPATGDLLPYTIGVHGIHVQRLAGGGLTARLNKAQHGGCHFIPMQCQTGTKTRCGFTSCGYSRDRQAIPAAEGGETVPEMYQYLGMRPERLPVLPLCERAGLLFVAIMPGPGAPPLLPPLPKHAAATIWLEVDAPWQAAASALAGEGVWHLPNLVLLENGPAACAVVLQPLAPGRTLCRLTAFGPQPPDEAAVASWRTRIGERIQADAATAPMPEGARAWLDRHLRDAPKQAGGPRPDSAYASQPRFNAVM